MYAVVLSEPFTVKAIPKVVNEEVESMDYVERGTLTDFDTQHMQHIIQDVVLVLYVTVCTVCVINLSLLQTRGFLIQRMRSFI